MKSTQSKLACLIALIVDDLLCAGNAREINALGIALGKKFSLTDKGPVKWFLAMEITRDMDNIKMTITQALCGIFAGTTQIATSYDSSKRIDVWPRSNFVRSEK